MTPCKGKSSNRGLLPPLSYKDMQRRQCLFSVLLPLQGVILICMIPRALPWAESILCPFRAHPIETHYKVCWYIANSVLRNIKTRRCNPPNFLTSHPLWGWYNVARYTVKVCLVNVYATVMHAFRCAINTSNIFPTERTLLHT